jgi:pimeloyl-ACP methyl ester carboxylesterase
MAFFSSAAEDANTRRTIIDRGTGGRLSPHWVDIMVTNSLERSTPKAVGTYLRSWARTDISEKVTGIKLPVHVIVGEHDAAINEAFARRTWQSCYAEASIEVIQNAGHYSMDETPVLLATSVERFLNGL